MGSDYEYGGTVIRPPIESISSGKVFKPGSKLRNKYWFEAILMGLLFWVITIGTFFGAMLMVSVVDPEMMPFDYFLTYFWEPVNFWFWVVNLSWLIPTLVFIPIYLNSFEYSVRAETGESMPEVYVKKGIITVTRKHVPFRSITNVSTRAGPLDRIFGIGVVEIETAGYSGISQEGPEEKIAGITFFEELRDFILQELRKFREPYVIGTETSSPSERQVHSSDGSTDGEILITLREMRDLLKDIERKLGRRE
jgi:membrane protein YdbS with pleckstrin-like domain